jgi:hypothetical protein
MGAAPTADELQAVVATATEIPTNASLRRDAVIPRLGISTSAFSGLVAQLPNGALETASH